MRTAHQIIKQTNDLAHEFYSMLGYTVPKTYRFWIKATDPNTHPQ